MWITAENVKSIHDLLGTGSTPNIQEVGRKASIEFDNVHGCHCQPCSIDWKQQLTIQL